MNETCPGEAYCSIVKETVSPFQQNEWYPISMANINILLSIFLRIFAFNGKKLISLKRFSAKMKWDTDLSSDVNSTQLAVTPYSTTLRILRLLSGIAWMSIRIDLGFIALVQDLGVMEIRPHFVHS